MNLISESELKEAVIQTIATVSVEFKEYLKDLQFVYHATNKFTVKITPS